MLAAAVVDRYEAKSRRGNPCAVGGPGEAQMSDRLVNDDAPHVSGTLRELCRRFSERPEMRPRSVPSR